MITDEMIKQICVKHGYQLKSIKNGQPDLGAYVYSCARELIELARKPKKLVFEQEGDGDLACFSIPMGWYRITTKRGKPQTLIYNGSIEIYFHFMDDIPKAMAAAQADYERRVGECFE